MAIDADVDVHDGVQSRHRFEGRDPPRTGRPSPFDIAAEEFANNEQLKAAIYAAAGPRRGDPVQAARAADRDQRPSAPPRPGTSTTDLRLGRRTATPTSCPGAGSTRTGSTRPARRPGPGRPGRRAVRPAPRPGPAGPGGARPGSSGTSSTDLLRLHDRRPVMYSLLAAAALAVLVRFAGGTQRLGPLAASA